MLKSFFCPAHAWARPPSMAVQVITSWDGILHAPTCCIHVNQATTPHKDLRLQITFEMSAHEHIYPLQVQSCWHMHSAPPKKVRVWPYAVLLHLSKLLQWILLLPHILHVPMPWHSKRPHLKMASCWKLLKHLQCSHIFCINVNQAIAHSEFLWGLILLVAFSDCPSFTFVVSFSFHGKMCNSALGLVPLQPSLLPPMVGFISSQARVLLLCPYVWNLGIFHLSTTKLISESAECWVISVSKVKCWQHTVWINLESDDGIFVNISFVEMESSKSLNYSTDKHVLKWWRQYYGRASMQMFGTHDKYIWERERARGRVYDYSPTFLARQLLGRHGSRLQDRNVHVIRVLC
jgi:uncharacterized Tic20 family protein